MSGRSSEQLPLVGFRLHPLRLGQGDVGGGHVNPGLPTAVWKSDTWLWILPGQDHLFHPSLGLAEQAFGFVGRFFGASHQIAYLYLKVLTQ